jgi:hypothetical protein
MLRNFIVVSGAGPLMGPSSISIVRPTTRLWSWSTRSFGDETAPPHRHMVLDQHAIMQQRQSAGLLYGSIGSALRTVKDNVERLPLAGHPASVHQRRRLSIKRGAGTIRGRLVLVIIQNLEPAALL